MSHIVQIQTQVRDASAVVAACQRLGLAPPVQQTAKLFTSSESGLTVKLPGWTYPVVFDVASGGVKFDNYNGRWGDPVQLDLFLQSYAVENSTRPQCTSCNGFL